MNTIRTMSASCAITLASAFAAYAEGTILQTMNNQFDAVTNKPSAVDFETVKLCNDLRNNTLNTVNMFIGSEEPQLSARLEYWDEGTDAMCILSKGDEDIAHIAKGIDHVRGGGMSPKLIATSEYIAKLLLRNMPEQSREWFKASAPALGLE